MLPSPHTPNKLCPCLGSGFLPGGGAASPDAFSAAALSLLFRGGAGEASEIRSRNFSISGVAPPTWEL